MSKRGRDLFELLEMRQSGGSSSRGRKRKRRPRDTERGRRAGAWFSALVGSLGSGAGGKPGKSTKSRKTARPSKSGKRKEPKSGPAPLSIPGTWLVALLLLALGGGFLLGRTTAGAKGSDELRTGNKTAKLMPGRLTPKGGSSDLGLQNEVETLSQYCYLMLVYRDSQRAQASQMAEYLRDHGLETARIRPGSNKKTGSPIWVVVVYVLDKDRSYVDEIKAVPPPAFDTEKFVARQARDFPARFGLLIIEYPSSPMSIHSSLKTSGQLKGERNVWTRMERIQALRKVGLWEEGQPVLGLPKVRTTFKVKSKKQLKAEANKPDEAAASDSAEKSEGQS